MYNESTNKKFLYTMLRREVEIKKEMRTFNLNDTYVK